MAWMWSFPSARKMWDSVYESGQGGALGLVLPEGEIELVLHGTRTPAGVLVTAAHLVRIVTDESPYTFALGHTGIVVFHDGANFEPGAASPRLLLRTALFGV